MTTHLSKIGSLLISIILLSVNGISAQNIYLKVIDNNDNSSIFTVDENLNIDSDGTYITVHSSKSEMSMKISDFRRFSYESDIVTTVPNISTSQHYVEIKDGNIRIACPDKRSHTYRIVDLNGSVIIETTFSECVLIPMDPLCNGVYVMKIDNFPSIKLLVK